MGVVIRVIQIVSACAGVALFGLLAYSDPANPPTRPMLLIGTMACGLIAMFLVTFIVTLALYGSKAARSIEWY